METKFTKSATMYIAGSNQEQRNWRVDIFQDDKIFCSVYGATQDGHLPQIFTCEDLTYTQFQSIWGTQLAQ